MTAVLSIKTLNHKIDAPAAGYIGMRFCVMEHLTRPVHFTNFFVFLKQSTLMDVSDASGHGAVLLSSFFFLSFSLRRLLRTLDAINSGLSVQQAHLACKARSDPLARAGFCYRRPFAVRHFSKLTSISAASYDDLVSSLKWRNLDHNNTQVVMTFAFCQKSLL